MKKEYIFYRKKLFKKIISKLILRAIEKYFLFKSYKRKLSFLCFYLHILREPRKKGKIAFSKGLSPILPINKNFK